MEWQPIETAPKDGTEIIVFDPTNEPPVFTASFVSPWTGWSCSVEGRYAPDDDFFGDTPKRPTHWMHLPKLPVEESA